ncbi:hypothetical protein DT73_08590 [Mangrovibacter sp. MFB070]|uniref:lysozyme inhibitor LprI family protein n=1 Tax=Mangrovibacter sp. MFB070 TaxID=1224318 RepID=UPI0004D45E49|nr:lysozyme inhibitor LprI family protein [Mangrovibacter sp. MFB070]KEA53406.1 hypothetical protein DT73_08590 [Mangrovibacter sp. MFB070]
MPLKHIPCALLLLLPFSVFAALPGESIDNALLQCKNNAENTLASQLCYKTAITQWDAELGKQYKLLMNGQPENVRVALRDSQRLWIKYRDAYIEAMKTYYQQEQGTIWGLVAAESIMNITRDKALDLYRLRNSTNLGD